MIIWFEGPDGSGKTTLNNAIQQRLRKYKTVCIFDKAREIYCEDKPTAANRVDEKTLLRRVKGMLNSNDVYLFERGPISDNIYRVFDKHIPVTTINKFVDLLIKNERRVFAIYCRTDLAEQKMLERGDENPVAIEKHKELTKIYDIVMGFVKEKFKFNFVRFDYSKRGALKDIVDKVDQFVFMSSKEK